MIIRVKAHPKSKKELIVKKSDDRFEIFVKEKPENGAANSAVLSLISEYFSVSVKKMRIIRGVTTPNKIIELF